MKTSAELRQERASLVSSQQAFVDKAKEEKRSLTADETTQFDTLQTQIDELDGEILRSEKFEDNIRKQAMDPAQSRSVGKPGGEERELQDMKERYSLHKAIRSQLPNGKLDGVELEMHQETVKRAKDSNVEIMGLAVPMGLGKRSEKRADGQTVTQDSGGYGANLVPTDLQSPIEFLRPKPILASLGATMLTGLSGDLKFPVNDGGIAAAWEGEVDEAANSKNAYSSKTMSPKRLAAAVLLSLQNLNQSAIDLERYTINEINAVIANAIDAAAINGAGTGGVPQGVLNTSGVNTVVGGTNGAAPTWAHIVAMETAAFVENANSARMNYLINPQTKGKLKTTAHEANALNYLMNLDNTINGYETGVSTLVPSNLTKGTASGVCSAGIFGDFSQLFIGQWSFLDLTVDNYSKKKEGYIELVANAFLDVMVRQPKAFSVVKDWLTT